jgi:hypothetical protein
MEIRAAALASETVTSRPLKKGLKSDAGQD